MKRRILCLAVLMLFVLSGCGDGNTATVDSENREYIEYDSAGNDVNSTEYEVAAENEYLILRINPDTTDIEVINKKTGYVWKSNSAHQSGTEGKILELTYLNASGKTETMNTMDDSVKKGQYKIETTEKGVNVTYSLGDIVTDVIYPTYISAERFEGFTEKMSKRQQAVVAPLYLHLAEGVYTDEMYEEFLEKYPNAKGKDAYVLREADMLSNIKKQVSTAFADAGYTEEDLIVDSEEFGVESSVGLTKSIQFNVMVEYVLDGADLKVNCPAENIYWTNPDSGIEKISLLPYFGTPNVNDSGYFLLPDGSGSLMSFYNGTETAGQAVTMAVYGENLSVTANEKIYNSAQIILPVYGIKIGENALLCVLEKGDALADINVLSGSDTLAGRIWADFNLMDTQLVYAKALSNKNVNQVATSSYTMEQAEAYSGDIAARYHFLSGESANYSGMADYYSDYLFGDKTSKSGKVPLYLDVVSAIDYSKTVSGFTYDVVSTLTTFSEAQEIAEDLRSNGIDNQKIILSGWQKTGMRGGYVSKTKVSGEAGGKKGLTALNTALKDMNIDLFLDFDVQLVYKSALSGNVKKSLVSRTLVQQIAQLSLFDLSTFQKGDNIAYVMTEGYTADAISQIPDILAEYGASAASLRYIGKYNIPDYDDDDVTDRAEAAASAVKAIEDSKDGYSAILTQTGNAYTAPLVTDITRLPVYSRRYNNTVEVPFAAMVYSGHIDYSGSPLNLNGSTQRDLLKLIESGAGLSYTVAHDRDDEIKSSDFNELYSICYNDLKDSIKSDYSYLSEALDGVYGSRIKSHEILGTNLVKVTYENGTYFIINYNEYEVSAGGVKIAPTAYVKGGNP